jgi:hypothetical protein
MEMSGDDFRTDSPGKGRQMIRLTAIQATIVIALIVACAKGQSVPPTVLQNQPALGPAPSVQDSLELCLLDIDIATAEQELSRTDLWHSLLPRISLSASIAAKDMIFVDPGTSQPLLLPKDSYRLTVSLSISDFLDRSKHDQAALRLKRLQCQRVEMLDRQVKASQLVMKRLWENAKEIGMAVEELRMIEEIAKYRQLLFDQGKIRFDNLTRARLDLLNAARALTRLAVRQFELQLQPNGKLVPDISTNRYDSAQTDATNGE